MKESDISFKDISCEKCGKDKILVVKKNDCEWSCETCAWYGKKAEIKEDGRCYFEDGRIIDLNQPIEYCPICKNETVACVCLGEVKD